MALSQVNSTCQTALASSAAALLQSSLAAVSVHARLGSTFGAPTINGLPQNICQLLPSKLTIIAEEMAVFDLHVAVYLFIGRERKVMNFAICDICFYRWCWRCWRSPPPSGNHCDKHHCFKSGNIPQKQGLARFTSTL